MGKIIYRKAVKTDMPRILDLLKAFDLNMSDLKTEAFAVADDGGIAVGCCRIIELGGGCLELASVAVALDHQKTGIGGNLVKFILGCDRRRPIYLMCRAKKEEFYARNGFKIIPDENTPPAFFAKIKALIEKSKKSCFCAEGISMVKND